MTQTDNFLRKENPQITTQHRKRYSTSRSSYTKLPFPTNRLLVGRYNSTTPMEGNFYIYQVYKCICNSTPAHLS